MRGQCVRLKEYLVIRILVNNMIDEVTTERMFGYTSDAWSIKSNKPIWEICEICGNGRVSAIRRTGLVCKNCKFCPSVIAKMSVAKRGKWSGNDNPNYGGKITSGKYGDKNANWRGGPMSPEEVRDYYKRYRADHPTVLFLGKRCNMMNHKNPPPGYQWHHMIYDHADPEAHIVLLSKSSHTKIHNLLRAMGITIEHINEENSVFEV